jgi:hypothetical protein
MIAVRSQDEQQVFDELVNRNFKTTKNKSASRIAIEVGIQLTAFWGLTNLAIYVWRVCTGC